MTESVGTSPSLGDPPRYSVVSDPGTNFGSPPRRIVTTLTSTRLAWMPMGHVASVITIAIVSSTGVTWASIWLTGLVCIAAAYILALLDRDTLSQRGFENCAAAEWALLAPVAYLVLRAVRTHHHSWDGLGPMWVAVGNVLAIPVVFLVIQLWGSAMYALP